MNLKQLKKKRVIVMYIRKTKDEYEVQGNYGYGFECVTTESNMAEARKMLKDYITNDPSTSYKIVHKRVPIPKK
jgi:hypothetical protein